MSIELKVGQRVRLNNGEEHWVERMRGNDPLSVDGSGYGSFVINGILYHQDGRFADKIDRGDPLSVTEIISQPEQAAWKPKAGEDAVTRDGERVTGLRRGNGITYPLSGHIDGSNETHSWTYNGTYNQYVEAHRFDLIGPWEEPERDDWDTVIRTHEPETVHKKAKSRYHRKIMIDDDGEIDVYAVLDAFGVKSQPRGHAIKKQLLAGGRNGGKSEIQDIEESIASLQRDLELLKAKRALDTGE